jgi:hypothetical protein
LAPFVGISAWIKTCADPVHNFVHEDFPVAESTVEGHGVEDAAREGAAWEGTASAVP